MSGTPVLAQKFGGTSVSTPERRQLVVGHVRRARQDGYRVALVVSAMGRRGDPYATDTLLDLLRAGGCPVRPEDYTLMFVTGEMISAAVMSHTLNREGIPAVGLTGAQAGIFTDGHPTEAEVLHIDSSRMRDHLARGEVPVVTGGQGIVRETLDYNTLGRGASDTSGVAVGVSLGAEKVEIFTDVEGVASADPRVVSDALMIPRVSFDRMYEFARFGARVVHPRAIAVARKARLPVVVRSTFSSAAGTRISDEVDENVFSGVAALADMHTVTLQPETIDAGTLAAWERRRLIMSLVDDVSGELVLGCADEGVLNGGLNEVLAGIRRQLGRCHWLSIIGDSALVAERAREDAHTLAAAGAVPRARGTGPFRSTFLVDSKAAANGLRVLHAAYA